MVRVPESNLRLRGPARLRPLAPQALAAHRAVHAAGGGGLAGRHPGHDAGVPGICPAVRQHGDGRGGERRWAQRRRPVRPAAGEVLRRHRRQPAGHGRGRAGARPGPLWALAGEVNRGHCPAGHRPDQRRRDRRGPRDGPADRQRRLRALHRRRRPVGDTCGGDGLAGQGQRRAHGRPAVGPGLAAAQAQPGARPAGRSGRRRRRRRLPRDARHEHQGRRRGQRAAGTADARPDLLRPRRREAAADRARRSAVHPGRGVPPAAHQPAVRRRRPQAALHRGHQLGAAGGQVDDDLQPRARAHTGRSARHPGRGRSAASAAGGLPGARGLRRAHRRARRPG